MPACHLQGLFSLSENMKKYMFGKVKGIILEITKNKKGKSMQNGASETGNVKKYKICFLVIDSNP